MSKQIQFNGFVDTLTATENAATKSTEFKVRLVAWDIGVSLEQYRQLREAMEQSRVVGITVELEAAP